MSRSLELLALRQIGLSTPLLQRALALSPAPGARLARVVAIRRDHALVHDGRSVQPGWLWPALRLRLQLAHDALVVGDWVWLVPGPGTPHWIDARVPALNGLARRDPSGERQPLVANVDAALLVMGLDRDFNLRRLDRLLVLVLAARVEPVIVLTKADACADAAAAVARVQHHLGGAQPVCALDARDPQAAAAALARWLRADRTLVLLGSSGAGKSTLTASLGATGDAGATLLAGPVRSRDGRGQHTTTGRTLLLTPSGACVIDTPGLRQLCLDADAHDVRAAFGDVGAWAAHCRFRDCRHRAEPGCAVRDRVTVERLDSYQKLLREVAHDEGDRSARRAQLSLWKRRTRERRQRVAAPGGGEPETARDELPEADVLYRE